MVALPMHEPAPRRETEPVTAAAIVVLGCRVEPAGRLSGASGRRAARAARAFHEGIARLLIASGGVRWGGVLEADALCRELVLSGVPRESILLERRSNSTRQNACFVAQLIEERNGSAHGSVSPAELVLVTCDWHMPRALRCFGWVGLRAVGLPAESPGVGPSRRLVRSASEALSGWADRALLQRGRRR
jgi:uncharacterized SAM-binding protein YcdF (DUF218 family)